MTDVNKANESTTFWERCGRHLDPNPDYCGSLDSNFGSLLVEVRRLGGGLRCLSTVWLFIVTGNMYTFRLWADHNERFLYMLLEYVCGGELFTYLRNAGRFIAGTALFYATEIVLALEYLHSLSLVYRDLKPENLLLDRQGHLKLTDFGFAKKLEDR